MSRKVFISFLGTNKYVKAIYDFGAGQLSSPVHFIQEAAIEHTCRKWLEKDAIYIFMTEKARQKNWEDGGQNDPEYEGLKNRLDALDIKASIHSVTIPEGFYENEVWKMFDIVYSKLEKNDILFFDITHAFRSIPMLGTVLFNYARFMKDVHLFSVIYGAFESLGARYEAEAIPIDKRIAPVVDLSNMLDLQQYTEIVSGFETFGRVNKTELQWFVDHAEEDYHNYLKDICNALISFDDALVTNNMDTLRDGEFYRNFSRSFNKLKKDFSESCPAPLLKILGKLNDKFDGFTCVKNSWQNVEAAIDWAKLYGMTNLELTLTREMLASRVTELLRDYNPMEKDSNGIKKYKEYVNAICSFNYQKGVELKGNLGQYKETTLKLLELPLIKELRNGNKYKLISQRRNSLNHGSGDSNVGDHDYEEFEEAYSYCLGVIKKYENIQ